MLTKNKILTGLIGLLSLLGFIFGVYAGIYFGILREYVSISMPLFPSYLMNRVAKFAPLNPFVTCWLTFKTSADLIITCKLN